MTQLIKIGKKAKAFAKTIIKGDQPSSISFVRRIERVKTTRRICAMTFDDGPCALPANPDHFEGRALTDILLDTLAAYGAKGTFDVVGDTSGNYPDEAGKEGSPQWGGVAFDHYPDFGKDAFGGAVTQKQLCRRILDEGHDLTNHSYAHRLFGPQKLIYGGRKCFVDFGEVVADLQKLHDYIADEFDYQMTLSRPPHYVDRINGGLSSYDAYATVGYQYMAASFDGAGWLPLSSYEEEVESMVKPLREALSKDPNVLCGQIIFQKDGYNMSRRSPVADGLAKQLELLKEYGYEVVTVSELLTHSAIRDVEPEISTAKEIHRLLSLGHPVLFADNTFRSHAPITRGEFAMMLSGKEEMELRLKAIAENKKQKFFPDLPVTHPYSAAMKSAVSKGALSLERGKVLPDRPLTASELDEALHVLFGKSVFCTSPLTRFEVVHLLADLF